MTRRRGANEIGATRGVDAGVIDDLLSEARGDVSRSEEGSPGFVIVGVEVLASVAQSFSCPGSTSFGFGDERVISFGLSRIAFFVVVSLFESEKSELVGDAFGNLVFAYFANDFFVLIGGRPGNPEFVLELWDDERGAPAKRSFRSENVGVDVIADVEELASGL